MTAARRRTKAEINLLEQLGRLRQFPPDRHTKAELELDELVHELETQRGRLIDRYGQEHSEAIFRNWSPQAIRALGVRRVDGGAE